jgi:hypothetical protein
MGKPIHECKREYTEKDAYADYGRLLAMRDLRINHSELEDDEWCNNYFMAIVENMRQHGYDVDMMLYLYKKQEDGSWEAI